MKLATISLLIFTLILPVTSAAEDTSDQVAVYIPVFDGPQPLARNVATVLNLQTWRTLRRAPTPNPHKLDFGSGQIWWGDVPLPQSTPDAAEKAAILLESQMTLWGNAQNYGDGVVVQAHLTLPQYQDTRKQRHEFWQLKLSNIEIVADLPRREFEFSPIVLRSKLVELYSSPSALRLCPKKNAPCSGEPLGSGFKAFEHQGGWAHIRTNDGRVGWINLPGLSESQNEVVDFTGALISIYRGDWEQADRFLARVIDTPDIGTSIHADALLLRGMAAEQFGKSGRAFIETALEINPYYRAAIQYKVMSDISAATRSTSSSTRANLMATAKFLREHQHLFLENDPWLVAVSTALRELDLPIN